MKITAVRHGETEGNVQHIVQSHTDGKLTDRGRRQATEAGRLLAAEQFDAMFSSDLGRCVETAELILAELSAAGFTLNTNLRERSQGEYDGRFWEDLPMIVFEGQDIEARVPGGESWLQVEARVAVFLNDLYGQYPSGNVLLVTHGGPLKVMRSLVEGVALQDCVVEMLPNAGMWRGTMRAPVSLTAVA